MGIARRGDGEMGLTREMSFAEYYHRETLKELASDGSNAADRARCDLNRQIDRIVANNDRTHRPSRRRGWCAV